MARAAVIWQLLRARMTVISAVTYLSAALLPRHPLSPGAFLVGYLFVICTQFCAHALGDAADYASDTLNTTATPVTGGSRALLARPGGPPDPLPRHAARRVGHAFACFSLFLAAFVVPRAARRYAVAILVLAYAYGAPPFVLNHRGLGEVFGAVITNLLLPLYGAAVALGSAASDVLPPELSLYDSLVAIHKAAPELVLMMLPAFLIKVSCFVVLNMADRRPDWATGKRTLAVILGDSGSAKLVMHCHLFAYAIVLALAVIVRPPAVLVAALLATAPYGWRFVVRPLIVSCPYRKDSLLAPTLFHSTLLVWPFAVHACFVRLFVTRHSSLLSVEIAFVTFFAYVTVANVVGGRRAAKRAAKLAAPVVDEPAVGKMKPLGSHRKRGPGLVPSSRIARAIVHRYDYPGNLGMAQSVQSRDTRDVTRRSDDLALAIHDCDVQVVGAGIGGLVTAATLLHLGLSVIVLERRKSAHVADDGADVALWPGAVSILKELGVPMDFFKEHCFPLDTVRMCKMDYVRNQSAVLNTLNMREVTSGTGEQFVLVARTPLMSALRNLLPEGGIVRYGANVTSVDESGNGDGARVSFSMTSSTSGRAHTVERSLNSRVVIGADGARSALREAVTKQAGGDSSVMFCNEVCYRGVVDLRSGDREAIEKVKYLLPDSPEDHTMRINYGSGLRSSFGYMSNPPDPSIAYWWVKQVSPAMPASKGKVDVCTWPEPLKTLHDITPEKNFYVHAIEDSAVLPKWSSIRIALVGDSAHAVTPNMGQGACMAIEDAFVIANQLKAFWKEPDGHLEAFYNYEMARKPYATAVRSEARMQLRLGQLKHPVAVSFRETLLKTLPSAILERKLRGHNFPVGPSIKMFQEACALG